MNALLAAAHHKDDVEVLWVILAVCAFGAGIWCAMRNLIPAAVACALIGIVVLVFAFD